MIDLKLQNLLLKSGLQMSNFHEEVYYYTLSPRIQVHALIYETAYFLEWSGGFVYKCLHQIMRV